MRGPAKAIEAAGFFFAIIALPLAIARYQLLFSTHFIQQPGFPFQALLLKIISFFSHSNFWVIHVYSLLCFPLSAAIFYGVARHLKIHSLLATALAVVFSCLPLSYPQWGHWVSNSYYFVPLIWLLLLQIANQNESPLPIRPLSLWVQLFLGALIGAWHPYQGVFFLILLFLTTGVQSLRVGHLRPLRQSLAPLFATSLVIFFSGVALPNAPSLLPRKDAAELLTAPIEPFYALRPINFLTPIDHRSRFARQFTHTVHQHRLMTEGDQEYVGALGALGLLITLAYFFSQRNHFPLLRELGLIQVFIVLLGLTGAVSALLRYGVPLELQRCNRFASLIACGGLLGLGVLITQFEGSRKKILLIASALAILGPLDQVPSHSRSRNHLLEYLSKQSSLPEAIGR